MDHAPIQENHHRADNVGDETVNLGRRHEPGEIRLGFEERLPAVGHQIVHIGDGLSGDTLQSLPQFVPLRFMLRELAGNGFLRPSLNLRVDQKPRQVGNRLVHLRNLTLEPRRFDTVRVQSLPRHRRHFVEHPVHILEHGAHRRLDSCQELVLADSRRVAARLQSMPLPPAATVVTVLTLCVLALAAVVDAAAPGTEQMPREGTEFCQVAGAFHGVRGKLRLHASKRRIVDYAKGFVAVDQMPAFIGPARYSRSRASIELEATPQEPHFADHHRIRQNAPDRRESPFTAESRRHAAIPHPTCHFLESDRFRQVGVENESNRFGFVGMNGQPFLAFNLDDLVPVRRGASGPCALLMPLNQTFASPLGQDTAIIGSHDELHASGQRVRPFRDAHDFHAVLLQILNQHVRFCRPTEPIVLVDVQPPDFSRFRFLHQPQKLSTAARGATGFSLIDEVLQRLPRRPFTVFNLHGDARAVILGVA